MSVLVIDVGTSSIRASTIDESGRIAQRVQERLTPFRPSAGVVEFDPVALAQTALRLAEELAVAGAVRGVGITAQRASTVVWDRATGEPVGAGLGWQDLRTVGACLALRAQGHRFSPAQSATKLSYLLDRFDPSRQRDLCFGTIDSWLVWSLSGGSAHVTDASNAAVTGLVLPDATGWDLERCAALRVPESMLPAIVDSAGYVATASVLTGAPPICAVIGDQQGALIGHGCLDAGDAKLTFGTGGMLDICVGDTRPAFAVRGEHGTFPIVAWRIDDSISWGVEAMMLAAGTCVDWLVDGLGVLTSAAESDSVAASVADSGGVFFVPAFGGLATPVWDLGARGTLTGLDSSTTRAEVVRAVLEGVAHLAADLVAAAQADTGLVVDSLRVDGGMSANATFVQCVADACGLPVTLSSELEATTLGAAFLAGTATGAWRDLASAATTLRPRGVVAPKRRLDRERWFDARNRSLRTVPTMSMLEF